MARAVAVGISHHITQRGNYRQVVFEEDSDYRQYLEWLKHYSDKYSLKIWAYCLMNNHVHFVAVPDKEESMARTFNTLHMRYAQYSNAKRGDKGHLWQGRYYSTALDERHLYAAVRYVENNPIRGGVGGVKSSKLTKEAVSEKGSKGEQTGGRGAVTGVKSSIVTFTLDHPHLTIFVIFEDLTPFCSSQQEGAAGIRHKSRGRQSSRKTPKKLSERLIELYRQKYQGFGPTLAAEKIFELDGIKVSRETTRTLLIESGDWQKGRKRRKHRPEDCVRESLRRLIPSRPAQIGSQARFPEVPLQLSVSPVICMSYACRDIVSSGSRTSECTV
jgi:REP element-mobilizing transposase RayT